MSDTIPDPSRGAILSPCRTYRYDLWRVWSEGPSVAFIGLNPSTADELVDDPTTRRCIGFARAWGFGRMHIVNLFAVRATDPGELSDPIPGDKIGPWNDEHLDVGLHLDRYVVAAWGAHPMARERGDAVSARLRALGVPMRCLGRNKDGSPKHPLYLRADKHPVSW